MCRLYRPLAFSGLEGHALEAADPGPMGREAAFRRALNARADTGATLEHD
jgi:hypothetical protein